MKIRLVEGHNAYNGREVPYTLLRRKDGTPDFTTVDFVRVRRCLEKRLCGICGQPLGKVIVFVGGEGSTVFNDPPNHPECAGRAFLSCPFLKGERVRDPHTDADGDTYAVDSGSYGVFICLRYGWNRKTLKSQPEEPVQFGKLDREILERAAADGFQWSVTPTKTAELAARDARPTT